MSNGKTYILKLRTRRKAGELMQTLEGIATVLSFREVEDGETTVPGLDGGAAPKVQRTMVFKDPEAVRATRERVATELINKRRAEVYPVMAELLRRNQHAPLDTLVKLMNETSVRPLRNGPWKNSNIGPYLDYTMARMTDPTITSLPPMTGSEPSNGQ